MSKKISDKVEMIGYEMLITATQVNIKGDIIIPDQYKKATLHDIQEIVAVGKDGVNFAEGDVVRIKIPNLVRTIYDDITKPGDPGSPQNQSREPRLIIDPSRAVEIDGEEYLVVRPTDIIYKIKQ